MVAAAVLAREPASHETWRPGLRTVARDANLYFPDQDHLSGVDYMPFTLGDSQNGSFDPCQQMDVTFVDRDPSISSLAWGIYAWEDWPALGAGPAGAQTVYDRAVARLERQTSHLTEQVLWTGALTVGTDIETLATTVTPNANNRRLASTAATLFDGGGPHDITDAFGHILEWGTAVAGGERLWVHVEPKLLPFLAHYQIAVRNGNVLDMALADYRIVAGTGYDGSGPSDEITQTGESWIYVTTPVRVFESAIIPPSGDPQSLLNRATNRYRVAASRLVLAEWDLTVHGAIRVCTPPPGPDCSTTGS